MNGFSKVGTGGYAIAESPVYHPQDGKFYFVDIGQQLIGAFDPKTGQVLHYEAGELVAGVAPCSHGRLLAARKSGLFIFDPQTQQFDFICAIEADKPQNRPNDMGLVRCADGKVRVFLGTMPLNAQEHPCGGALYVLNFETGELIKLRENLTTTNGIAGYSEDDRTQLFFADTNRASQKIFKARFDPFTYTLGDEIIFKDMTQDAGRPDGAAMATVDGHLCHAVAALDAGIILFHDVATGQLRASLALPEGLKDVTKCAFSPNGDIFVTTMNRLWAQHPNHQDPEGLHGELYWALLPDNIEAYEADIIAAIPKAGL